MLVVLAMISSGLSGLVGAGVTVGVTAVVGLGAVAGAGAGVGDAQPVMPKTRLVKTSMLNKQQLSFFNVYNSLNYY